MTNNSLPHITELLLPGRTADSRSAQTQGDSGSSPASVEQFEQFLRTANSERPASDRTIERRPSRDPRPHRRADRSSDRDQAEAIGRKRQPARDKTTKADDRDDSARIDDRDSVQKNRSADDSEAVKTGDGSEPVEREDGSADDGNRSAAGEETEAGGAEEEQTSADSAAVSSDPSDELQIVELDATLEDLGDVDAVDGLGTDEESIDQTDEIEPELVEEAAKENGVDTSDVDAGDAVDEAEDLEQDADVRAEPIDGSDVAATVQPIAAQQSANALVVDEQIDEVVAETPRQVETTTAGDSVVDQPVEAAVAATAGDAQQADGGSEEAAPVTDLTTDSADGTGDQPDQQGGEAGSENQANASEADEAAPISTIAASSAPQATSGTTTTTTNTIASIGEASPLRDGGQVTNTAGTTQAEQADGADPLWRQVRRALGSLRNLPTGEQQLTIRLRPDDLGSVVVRISTGEAGTTVALVAESAAAASQLNQQRQSLIDELREGGLRGVAVDVGTSDAGQPDGDDSEADVDQGNGRRGSSLTGVNADGELVRSYRGRSQPRSSEGLIDVDL